MRMKLAIAVSSALLLSACVTRTINSDGSVQSTVIDKNKLSDTYIDLAIEYQQHSAPQVALERANLAVSTKDDNPKAYMIRAMIYQQLGQYDKAEQDFKKHCGLIVSILKIMSTMQYFFVIKNVIQKQYIILIRH